MRKISLKLLRMFTFLLLTVFAAESVLANAMMASELKFSANTASSASVGQPLLTSNTVKQNQHSAHCHDMSANMVTFQQDQTHQKRPANSICKQCSHCLACFSVIPPAQFSPITILMPRAVTFAYGEIYLSPFSAQPQKPPIA